MPCAANISPVRVDCPVDVAMCMNSAVGANRIDVLGTRDDFTEGVWEGSPIGTCAGLGVRSVVGICVGVPVVGI